MNSKLNAKNLPCLFNFFANSYPESKLAQCEVKEDQKWRHASANAAIKRITEIAKYFSKLFLLLNSLENYSLCEKHYNQVIAKNFFIKQLKANNLIFSNLEEEFQTLDLFEKKFSDFGVQVFLLDPAHESLLKRIDELENLNKQLLFENETLKKRVNERFTDQQDRIESIIEIAKKERSNVYKDIVSLIKNHERFCLDNLLEYFPSKWLAEQNPVIVKFLETFTYNRNEHQHEGEKLFKCAVAVDAIYGSRHLKYVSAINMVASAIKYSLSRSKMIIFHTVTSFITFNYDQNNNIQITDP